MRRLEERRVRVAALCAAAALGLTVPFCGGWFSGPAYDSAAGVSTSAAAAAVGTVTLESAPSGAIVVVDGTERGKTPLQVSLAPGDHPVEISSGSARRQLTATVAAGGASSFYVELTGGAELGGLEVMSDPPGAQVSLDGVSRGVTPLVLSGLAPGEHEVRLSRDGRTINRPVRVTAGATASVVLSLAASDAAGWVSFKAPFEMKVLEKGTVLGTTASNRIMLPAGAHTFDLVSEALDFTTTLPVRITAGRTVTATVPVPTGLLSVNALPWAEVLIDGESVGTTPLGNLAVPIGSREVVWRHPQFGERRQRVEVKAGAPVRIGVDFTQ